ncbi:hypothetical protein B5X24_HaOG203404 [Helicoverpa armigera]|uniref:Neurotransmitter-gated ion-channel ligand-binding domain-containing protein n=1 Tax=Helicoverpa armigera TaxID=29058 RepID=A0A2W1BUZ3_HELAM|nr:hypothetical protein B5X24_HaOG203404 [Helicoverpa armigera]
MDIPRPSCALVLVLLFVTHLSECMNGGKINFREKEKQILDQILGPGRYDARIRPSGINGTDGPAVVSVNIFVRSISKIDDVTMFLVLVLFNLEWLVVLTSSSDGALASAAEWRGPEVSVAAAAAPLRCDL